MNEDAHDEEWPHTDEVAVRSQQHRTDGNWAIDTANPDGWGNILEYLKLSSADFVVGQESKRATKADCELAESAAKTAGWKASLTMPHHAGGREIRRGGRRHHGPDRHV